MLPCYVVLDLETTGGNAVHDRITEIAAVRVEHGEEVARWSTLVNPGVRIPQFIQSLTGITDAMVEHAPGFDEVAEPLAGLLKGAVLVAHNVRFDHSFVVQEFERIGVKLQTKTLCTVRLSRKLFPQHKGHGLDAIMRRHGLQTEHRHRAMGDVEMVLAWLHIARTEFGAERLQSEATALMQGSACLPPHLETPVTDIPNSCGVYLLYGEGMLPLYIGKSVHIRERVLSHFQSAAKVAREMRILQEVRRVEWRLTAGELGALLLESKLIKEMQPVYNRRLRRERELCTWQLHEDANHQPQLTLVQLDAFMQDPMPALYGSYRSKRHAQDALREIAEMNKLCQQTLGLENGSGRCFGFQVGTCKGACCGGEPRALHRVRLQIALNEQRLHAWPYAGKVALREHDPVLEHTEFHIFDQWCHVATVKDEAELEDALQARNALAFDIDTYRLLFRQLPARKDTLVVYPSAHTTD